MDDCSRVRPRAGTLNAGTVMTTEPSFPGRGVLDRVERSVGVPLAAVTNSPQFSVALVLVRRAEGAVRALHEDQGDGELR